VIFSSVATIFKDKGLLHNSNSGSLAINSKRDPVSFHSYFTIKDIIGYLLIT